MKNQRIVYSGKAAFMLFVSFVVAMLFDIWGYRQSWIDGQRDMLVSLAQPGKHTWIPGYSMVRTCCAVSCYAYPTRTVYQVARKKGKEKVAFFRHVRGRQLIGRAKEQGLRKFTNLGSKGTATGGLGRNLNSCLNCNYSICICTITARVIPVKVIL